jgi:general secretion pathway protein G
MKLRSIELKRNTSVRKAGFTLIEVLLVIVIILMLAGALVVFVLPQQEGAERNTTRLLLRQVENALDNYRLNVGRYPSEEEGGLGALLVRPNFENERLADRWQGPYIKRGVKLEDAWGYQLQYELVDRSLSDNPSGPAYRLFSVGPDGQPDTEDDIRTTEDEDETGVDSRSVLDQ